MLYRLSGSPFANLHLMEPSSSCVRQPDLSALLLLCLFYLWLIGLEGLAEAAGTANSNVSSQANYVARRKRKCHTVQTFDHRAPL